MEKENGKNYNNGLYMFRVQGLEGMGKKLGPGSALTFDCRSYQLAARIFWGPHLQFRIGSPNP